MATKTATMNPDMTFGVEIELYGIGKLKAARAVRSVTGGTVTGDPYGAKVTAPDGRVWSCVNDGSINDTTGLGGCEVVTPILKYADIETLQAVVRALREAGGKANESCGVHVHLGANFFDAPAVVRLTKLVHKWQPWIEKALEISDSRIARWCKPTELGFVAALQAEGPRPTMDRLSQIWYGGRNCGATHYHSSRYHGLNLHAIWNKGTIEFRWFNGTTHAGKIKAYVQFVMALGQRAIEAKAATLNQAEFVAETAGYDFRNLLIQLNLVKGDEFKTLRELLMMKVPAFAGTFAWAKVAQVKAARKAEAARVAAAAAEFRAWTALAA